MANRVPQRESQQTSEVAADFGGFERADINMQRVREFRLLIDIDSTRLPITDEWNYVFAA